MRPPTKTTRGFTTKAPSLVNVLTNDVFISEAFDPTTGTPELIKNKYKAIWDTGATNTAICRKIVEELNLQPSGRVTVSAVGRTYESNTYLINILLPNHVGIPGLRVSEGQIASADILLGMDIINHGDLAITNHNGKTWWTFRTPSNESIDFVQEIKEYNNKVNQGLPPKTRD